MKNFLKKLVSLKKAVSLGKKRKEVIREGLVNYIRIDDDLHRAEDILRMRREPEAPRLRSHDDHSRPEKLLKLRKNKHKAKR